MKSVRNIQFEPPEKIDWSQGQAGKSIEAVYSMSLAQARTAVDWYWARKGQKGLGARATRLAAIFLVAISGLTPLVAEIITEPKINPLWASVALALAATAVALDKFFGFSPSYIRYVTTAMKLESMRQDFNFERESRRANLAGTEPTSAQILESLEVCRRFVAQVSQTVQAETENWVQDFTTAIAEIDKGTRAETQLARGGAINIAIVNADKLDAGWQLLVDGGTPEQRSGKTAAVRDLVSGTHALTARGSIGGVTRAAERNVSVTAGAIAEVELTLA